MCSSARLALAALLVAAGRALGGVVPQRGVAPAGPPIPPRRGDLPPAVSQRQASDLPTLRCWQEGRLVLEQAGVSFAEAPAGAHVFRRNGRNGQPVYLFDMKHGLCVLSHEPVSADSALAR